uniref:Putative secreted protein n=1 Tax=Ixodes scapularis TaxID=6945 RepID=A0A4D5RFB0_IXOSC
MPRTRNILALLFFNLCTQSAFQKKNTVSSCQCLKSLLHSFFFSLRIAENVSQRNLKGLASVHTQEFRVQKKETSKHYHI